MARVTFCKPHLLLLDEPSNHLDMDAVEALVEVSACRVDGWMGAAVAGVAAHCVGVAVVPARLLLPARARAALVRPPPPPPRHGRRRAWRCFRAACSWFPTTST